MLPDSDLLAERKDHKHESNAVEIFPPAPPVSPVPAPEQTIRTKPKSRPTHEAVMMVFTAKVKLLHLAVEQEALRQLYGDEHECVVALRPQLQRIQRLLFVTNITGNEYSMHSPRKQ